MALPSEKKRKIFDGRYEVLSIVGRGLDSVVYHAKHLSGGEQEVALKVLVNKKGKSSLTERLRKEALTLVSCRHKYVVRLDDFHSVGDLCYLSMEYAPLGDLRKHISSMGKPLSAELGTELLRQSLEALEFVHATGVLHRDIKPDNILVVNEREIRLADFGLALLPGDEIDIEELQNGVGSLAYLPPEMLDGQFYDSRSDLYSLGVCFYEAMAGFHPFEQAPLSEQKGVRLDKNIKPLHEVNPLVPTHVSAVITTLMRYSADDRFPTAMEALRALSDSGFNGEVKSLSGSTLDEEIDDFDDGDYLRASEPAKSLTVAANSDDIDDDFTNDFDDFFGDLEESPFPGSVPSEPPSHETEEMTAQRVQQLIDQSAKAATMVSSRVLEEPAGGHVSPPSSRVSSTPHQQAPQPAEVTTPSRQTRSVKGDRGALSALMEMPPLARIFVVGLGAAVVTIALVLLSHVEPMNLMPGSYVPAVMKEAALEESNNERISNSIFPNIPSGTYAGSIEGVLPGVTSPLALIARPEQNSLTVVVGIDGWTPATVSIDADAAESSPTIVVRSNGVLLNMTGELSDNQIVGTFSNAITGETGVWSAQVVSK